MPVEPQAPRYFLAQPSLKVAGNSQPDLDAQIQSVLVEENTDGLYRCEVSLVNWGTTNSGVGYLYFDRQLLEFGKEFAVAMGAGDGAATVFSGRISGLEGRFPRDGMPPLLTVLAEDRLFDLRMTRRTRSFEQASDEDVMRQIASDHGLQADIDITGPGTYSVLTQVNQTDLAFLRERARAIDAELWVDGKSLHAQAHSRRRGADLALNYGPQLWEFEALADLAGQRSSLTVSGWDVAAKEAIAAKAESGVLGSELGSLQSGSQVLSAAFGDRHEQIASRVPLSDQEARFAAEAAYRRIARRFVTGMGLAQGDGRIRVGAKVTLNGVGPLFGGSYYVTECRHTFDREQGYTTRFRVERAGIGG